MVLALGACGDDGADPYELVPCGGGSGAGDCARACVGQVAGGHGSAADVCEVRFTTQGGQQIGRKCTPDEVIVVDGEKGCCVYAGDPAVGDPFATYWSVCGDF